MKPVTKRRIVVISIAILILCYTFFSLRFQIGLPCLFHHFTGWFCPGCGLGRSVRHLFTGIWCFASGNWSLSVSECRLAFRYNVLLMPCIIPGILLLLYTAWQYMKGVPYRDYLFIRIMERFGFIIAGIMLAYGILRNLLVILAPPC